MLALSPEEQEILLLRDLEGMEGNEVQVLLGLTNAAMKSRLHRSRLRLMQLLRKEANDEG
jgi:DNA-directed RNA polymerase specialized sigma24 family protein